MRGLAAGILVILFSAFLGARAGRRALRTIAHLWLLFGAVFAAALLLTQAGVGHLPEAVLFIGAFAVAPFLLLGSIGLAAGALLRRPPARAPPTAPPATPAVPASAPPPPSDWCARHVGTERDGLILDGIDVWATPWRRTGSLRLPHPAHPAEQHDFAVYEAAGVTFAATELSASVWGFYTPAPPPHLPDEISPTGSVHVSPDGSLRVTLTPVEWSNTHWVESPTVTEPATGRVLLDLANTDWDAEVRFPGLRCVQLALRRYGGLSGVDALLDLANDRYLVSFADRRPSLCGRLAHLRQVLDGIPDEPVERPRRIPPPRPRPPAWRSILLITAGAALAIAAVSLIAVRTAPQPGPVLTPLPAMPK